MVDLDEKPTSALFEHCVNVYEAMKSEAREEDFDTGWRDERTGLTSGAMQTKLVYEGHLTKLFAGLGLSTPYYTAVRKQLIGMGCIEQIRRGGGNSSSRWILNYAPSEEHYKVIEQRQRPPSGKVAMLEQQVRNLIKRVTDLEDLGAAYQQLLKHHNDLRHVVDRIAVDVERINDERGAEKVR